MLIINGKSTSVTKTNHFSLGLCNLAEILYRAPVIKPCFLHKVVSSLDDIVRYIKTPQDIFVYSSPTGNPRSATTAISDS